MNILVINGSPMEKSRTRGIAKLVKELLEEQGVMVTYYDLGIEKLPLFPGDEENAPLRKLYKGAQEADGFFIASPEYHNGMSGVLKNALDFLGGTYFKHKPAAIAAASGGSKGGINALNNMRTVLRGLYAVVLPDQYVSNPECYDENYDLVDRESVERLQVIAGLLVELTEKLGIKQEQDVR
ncbi:NADPH-dependent FMN reductase [Pseudalkalibacillus salsuginis]|uniref:NADPH-dependent FMN reductase n=1 Tax=Pseudalkalibacillus salsuginis TaxID=2910972 RepID=UPI001F265927|nr:NADPH-dependent FMN reductase [Pseudalkalibacillus salsuginis]MCF6410377.1 NAD(P)H-dependent oxidoreductase [Pseudalkalibacillus salsuginis]